MGFLYLKDRDDQHTLRQVKKLIAAVPDSVRRLFRVIEKPELTQVGCDPAVALAIEPVKGVAISTARQGDAVTARGGGSHGYSCGIDHTALVAYGAGVTPGRRKEMNQTDIKGFVLRLLGIR